MKKTILLLLTAITIMTTGCDRDPYPLELERYDVFWFDYDNSGTRSVNDKINFQASIQTTDPDPDDQVITQWELSYSVSGHFGGVLTGDTGIRTNSVNLDADIFIDKLIYPGGGPLQGGDQLEFRLLVTDNYGTQVEKFYSFGIEE